MTEPDMPDTETSRRSTTASSTNSAPMTARSAASSPNADLLLLTTTGAKSGQQRMSPLAYFRIDGKLIIIGSFAGAPVDPAWVHNLRANPQAHIEVGTDAFDVTAHELPLAERDAAVRKVTAAAPGFAEYQAKTSRVIPLFELQRA